MSYFLCLIVVIVAVQSVFGGKVQEIKMKRVNVEIKEGRCTVTSGTVFGKNTPTQAAIGFDINEIGILKGGGIALVPSQDGTGHYILVNDTESIEGLAFFQYTFSGPNSRNIDNEHVKIVKEIEDHTLTDGRKCTKITYASSEFKSDRFGALMLNLGVGKVYIDVKKNDMGAIQLSALHHLFGGDQFVAVFKSTSGVPEATRENLKKVKWNTTGILLSFGNNNNEPLLPISSENSNKTLDTYFFEKKCSLKNLTMSRAALLSHAIQRMYRHC